LWATTSLSLLIGAIIYSYFGNRNSENYNKQTSTRYTKELIFFAFLSFDVFDKRGGAGATQTGDGWIRPEGTRRKSKVA
jgi:hypothetical protein